ncbi:hypothetical protein C0992_008499 [Termitomyces sp. T32_za158]|nr:hypothetical protein C0992_008499 [Termitomyces sp. T32_za158]
MTNAYLTWHNESTSNVSQSAAGDSDDFGAIPAIDIYTLVDTINIHQTTNTPTAIALVRAGYVGNSPVHPSLAVSIKTLELFRVIRLHRPSFSVEAFAKTLSYLYGVPFQQRYRNALSDVFDVYLDIHRRIDSRVAKSLGHNAPNYRVLHACPPCSYELQGEPAMKYSRLIVIDGNNSLKQIRAIGK